MHISIVVASAENGAIGKNNSLLWRLPDDLKYFKAITMGKPIVMGRKTYQSIGRPLPGRQNIVVTRHVGFEAQGCTVVTSIDDAIQAAGGATEICVIGGADIYSQILPRVNTVYLTEVHVTIEGDVFFPSLPATQWRETHRHEHAADQRHAHSFSFVTLERKL
jgi:dihydrofolate reductase